MKSRIVSMAIWLFIAAFFSSLNIMVRSANLKSRTIVVPDDYMTIQEAVNTANPGDTIFVKNRVYYEHVKVNKSVTLQGERVGLTIIDGNFTRENLSPKVALQKIGVTASSLIDTFDDWYDLWKEDGKSGTGCLAWEVWSEINADLPASGQAENSR